jgi:Family of unknown function (DUF5819)
VSTGGADQRDRTSVPPTPAGGTEHHAGPRVRPVVAAFAATVALVVGLHVLVTFLAVAPRGPVSATAAPLVDRWISPLFGQNWNLFAPNPLADDRGLLVRVRHDRADPGGDFTDLTTPDLDGIEGHLIPARTTRLSTTAVEQLQRNVRVLQRYSGAGPDGSCPPRRTDAEILAEARQSVSAVLGRLDRLADGPCVPRGLRNDYRMNRAFTIRLALSSLPEPVAARATEVQVRLVIYRYPRFADRDERYGGQITTMTFPWWSVRLGR